MVLGRCEQVSSRHGILGKLDALSWCAQGGRAKRRRTSAVQRVRVQPLLVSEQSAQGQGDLPVLIAFRPWREGPGMKQRVAPKQFETVHRVKRFRSWNSIGRWHVVSPSMRRERYRTPSHRWVTDGAR